jgi:plastocyanin
MRKWFAMVLSVSFLAVACAGQSQEGSPRTGTTKAQPAAPPAGCAETGGGTLKVLAVDNEFKPTCLAVSADQEILVKHEGTYTHTFTIGEEEAFRTPFLIDLEDIESGDRVRTGPIGDIAESGTYPFFCKFHGGMQGELYVVA